MSYSFSAKAATKSELKSLIAEKVAEIAHQQPVHAADQAQIVANANAIIDLLPENVEGRELQATINGYLSGTWDNEQITELTQVSINANIGWVTKTA